MSDEQERLAATVNEGIEAASGCCSAYLLVLLFFASPVIGVGLYMVLGPVLSEAWPVVVGVAVAFGVIVLLAYLTRWRR